MYSPANHKFIFRNMLERSDVTGPSFSTCSQHNFVLTPTDFTISTVPNCLFAICRLNQCL